MSDLNKNNFNYNHKYVPGFHSNIENSSVGIGLNKDVICNI